jgi:hypothetical protein
MSDTKQGSPAGLVRGLTRRRAVRIVAAAAGLPLMIAAVRATAPGGRLFERQGEVLGAAAEEGVVPVCADRIVTVALGRSATASSGDAAGVVAATGEGAFCASFSMASILSIASAFSIRGNNA